VLQAPIQRPPTVDALLLFRRSACITGPIDTDRAVVDLPDRLGRVARLGVALDPVVILIGERVADIGKRAPVSAVIGAQGPDRGLKLRQGHARQGRVVGRVTVERCLADCTRDTAEVDGVVTPGVVAAAVIYVQIPVGHGPRASNTIIGAGRDGVHPLGVGEGVDQAIGIKEELLVIVEARLHAGLDVGHGRHVSRFHASMHETSYPAI